MLLAVCLSEIAFRNISIREKFALHYEADISPKMTNFYNTYKKNRNVILTNTAEHTLRSHFELEDTLK